MVVCPPGTFKAHGLQDCQGGGRGQNTQIHKYTSTQVHKYKSFPRYMAYEVAKEEAEDRAEKAEQKVISTESQILVKISVLSCQGGQADAKEVDPS